MLLLLVKSWRGKSLKVLIVLSLRSKTHITLLSRLAASLYPTMHVQQVALPMVVKAEMMHGLKGMPSLKFW